MACQTEVLLPAYSSTACLFQQHFLLTDFFDSCNRHIIVLRVLLRVMDKVCCFYFLHMYVYIIPGCLLLTIYLCSNIIFLDIITIRQKIDDNSNKLLVD